MNRTNLWPTNVHFDVHFKIGVFKHVWPRHEGDVLLYPLVFGPCLNIAFAT